MSSYLRIFGTSAAIVISSCFFQLYKGPLFSPNTFFVLFIYFIFISSLLELLNE